MAVLKIRNETNTGWYTLTSGSGGSVVASPSLELGVARWYGAAGQTDFDLPDYAAEIEAVAIGGLWLDPIAITLNDPGDIFTIGQALAAAATVQANYVIRTLA